MIPKMDSNTLSDVLTQADDLARQGNLETAIDLLQNALSTSPRNLEALTLIGRMHRANGNHKLALPALKKLCELTPKNAWAYYDFAEACEATGDHKSAAINFLKAWSLDSKNARFALSAGYALWQTGKTDEALSVWSIGSDMDPMVRAAQYESQANVETREKSQKADLELRRHLTRLYEDGLKKHSGTQRLEGAYWPQTHFGTVQYKADNQKPYMFYVPDFAPSPIFDTKPLEWANSLKDQTPSILEELKTYLQHTNDFGSPYVAHMVDGDLNWQKLRNSDHWNALHLYKNAQEQDCLKSFPKTQKALAVAPLVELFGTPMEVFFSILKPGTHIPPHFGLSNSRLTAHLPLIVPENCNIRVADQIHHWQEGELFLFDDSFDHEARNDSDEIRVVLIFETWRPDSSKEEITALQDSMEIRSKWLSSRHIPDFESLI